MNLRCTSALVAILIAACLPDLPPFPELETDASSSSSGSLSTGSLATESTGQPPSGTSTTHDGSSQDESSTNSASSESESTSFLPPPDAGFDLDECSTWAQDCPAGYKCMPWANDGGSAWNDTRCTPLDAQPMQPGDTCTVQGSGVSGVDDCDATAMCWAVEVDTNQGICTAFCTGSEAMPLCEDPATICSVSNEGALAICLQLCDPLVQDCVTGQGCYALVDGVTFACVPDSSNGAGQYPDECAFLNACAPGSACVPGDVLPSCTESCCAPHCNTADADPCPALDPALVCTPWFGADPPPAGYEHVGVCTLPQ